VYHLRIVTPSERAEQALELLHRNPSVTNVIHLEGVAQRPPGDVILADVAREDTSVVLSDLKELDIHIDGSIALEAVDTSISPFAKAAERAAKGSPADAVIWEQVEDKTSESAELSGSFVAFMALATVLSSVAILLDSPILMIGAMVVGPEFGPIAGFCVAAVQRRRSIAARSLIAVAVGFPLGILLTYLATLIFKATGVAPDDFSFDDFTLADTIAHPDFFAFFVAFCSGIAGMLSLSTAKSGALIGVLISVTTIPAASGVAVAAAYEDWSAAGGSLAQLAVNLTMILIAGTLTLGIQRAIYMRRHAKHVDNRNREVTAESIGRARRDRRAARSSSERSPRP
jgi:uncharacterized hydrophobic protein (TIGR00271 family)